MLNRYDIIRMLKTAKAIRSAELPRFLAFCSLTLWNKVRPGPAQGRPFIVAVNGRYFQLRAGKGEFDFLYETGIARVYEGVDGFSPGPADVAIDVGANFGGASLQWHRTVSRGTIYAIEPHPDTFRRLQRNIQLNHAGNIVKPVNLAIGAKEGLLPLYITEAGSMALKGPAGRHGGRRIDVPCLTLDAFAEQHDIDHIDLLKIDVEGFEHDVLQGAVQSLGKTNRIVLEYHSEVLKAQCAEVLSEAGFQLTTKDNLMFGSKRTRSEGDA